MKTHEYIATFTEGVLATKPNDAEIHKTFVAAKEREAAPEECPAGTTMRFSVTTLAPGLDKALDECWAYARLRFMGAWRNSGKGTAEITEVK